MKITVIGAGAIGGNLPERFAALPDNPTLDDVVGMNRAAHR
ncbi:hypothetical protein FAIPA1_260072 [Frankia sp. AiPs1]|nr:hypothetical protein [Frankia sp. AiPa1]